jgi:hypothetical protein
MSERPKDGEAEIAASTFHHFGYANTNTAFMLVQLSTIYFSNLSNQQKWEASSSATTLMCLFPHTFSPKKFEYREIID